MRVVAFDAVELMAALEHAVELVDQHGDGLVALVGLHGGIHVGAVDLDMALGGELHTVRGITITLELNAEPHDALLVTKQSLGFLPDERLERRGQIKVNAGDDYFVLVLAVHVSAYGFGWGAAGPKPDRAVKIQISRQRRALA